MTTAPLRVMSLFSGVAGMDRGLEAAGMEPVGFCEKDAGARSILRYHYPDIPIWHDVNEVTACGCRPPAGSAGVRLAEQRLGGSDGRVAGADDTSVDGGELDNRDGASARCPECGGIRGRVDVVAGGSPCQDLSVAGRRAGLDGARSGLFWAQCRVADSLAAPWVLWENVGGALSSNDGADFASVLWGLTGTLPGVPDGGWRTGGVVVGPKRTAVWRVLDARYFGVAQRRRRVFVVAGPREQCGPEVLLEPEGLRGNPAPRRQPGQAAARTARGGAQGGRRASGGRTRERDGLTPDTVGTLTTRVGAAYGAPEVDAELFIPVPTDDTVGTLAPGAHPGGVNGQDAYTGQLVPLEAQPVPLDDTVGTLTTDLDRSATGQQAATGQLIRVEPTPFDTTQITHRENRSNPQPGDPSPILGAAGHPPAIIAGVDTLNQDVTGDVAHTVRDGHGEGVPAVIEQGPHPRAIGFDSNYSGGYPITESEVSPPVKVGIGIGIDSPPAVAYACQGSNVGEFGTLRAGNGHTTGGVPFTTDAAYPLALRGRDDGAELEMGEPDVYNALRAGDGGSSRANNVLTAELAVRRLTPLECERLMGWDDNWTARGVVTDPKTGADTVVEIADSTRYRCCGNGVVSPVAEWIARRIIAATHHP